MQQVRASRGALGEGHVVINEGPDAYVMEDNRIRLEPGEALACVAVPEMWQGGGTILYRMSREEAEAWVRDASLPPHKVVGPDYQEIEDSPRILNRAYTEGTDFRAPIKWVTENFDDGSPWGFVSHRTNFIGHIQPK